MSDVNEITKTWLVFLAGEKKYALLASDVREILRDVPVFPLPFVPEYINGILNRYGEPYAVIDPLPVLGEKSQESKLFIVLHDESHMCLRITEVLEFYTTQESDLKFFSASESGKYYVGSFSYEDGEVLILNPESFVEVVENDIEKA
ncbi:MAG: chemotaxis protein CheW [Spirochaetaceae bacterium]|nr:chemotaxis protein CheW [Spirochaetaceae bacterium]